MGLEKMHKFELLAGFLAIVLGVTNIIQLVMVGLSDPRAAALFGVYGLLFLIGEPIYFVVSLKEMERLKSLIEGTSIVLFLMCPISNVILLYVEFGVLAPILVILSVINIILCVLALPIAFIRYVDLEEMDNREKLSYASIVLLRGSGIFHLLQPAVFGVSFETLAMFLFGVIYLAISIPLIRKKEERWVQLLGFLLPIIGAVGAIGLLLMALTTPYLLTFIVFDVIIILIRFYYIKTEPTN